MQIGNRKSKIANRLVALLLVPCLITELSFAFALNYPLSPTRERAGVRGAIASAPAFQEQALAPHVAAVTQRGHKTDPMVVIVGLAVVTLGTALAVSHLDWHPIWPATIAAIRAYWIPVSLLISVIVAGAFGHGGPKDPAAPAPADPLSEIMRVLYREDFGYHSRWRNGLQDDIEKQLHERLSSILEMIDREEHPDDVFSRLHSWDSIFPVFEPWQRDHLIVLLALELVHRQEFPRLQVFLQGCTRNLFLSDSLFSFMERLLLPAEPDRSEHRLRHFISTSPQFTAGNRTDRLEQLLETLSVIEAMGWERASAPGLQRFIRARLSQTPLHDRWTNLRDIPESDLLISAIKLLCRVCGQHPHYLDLYSKRLFVSKDDREVYFGKARPAAGDESGRQNDPAKELLALRLGRLIGANVAMTVIDPGMVRLFSRVYIDAVSDPLPQNTRSGAEAANLILNVWLRRWDDSSAMIQRSPMGSTFVAFDFDRSFDRHVQPLKPFVRAWQKQSASASQTWSLSAIDPTVLEEVLQNAERLDVRNFIEKLKQELSGRYHPRLMKFERYLLKNQKTLRSDTNFVLHTVFSDAAAPAASPSHSSMTPGDLTKGVQAARQRGFRLNEIATAAVVSIGTIIRAAKGKHLRKSIQIRLNEALIRLPAFPSRIRDRHEDLRLADIIKKLIDKGFSVRTLANVAHVSETTVYGIRNGRIEYVEEGGRLQGVWQQLLSEDPHRLLTDQERLIFLHKIEPLNDGDLGMETGYGYQAIQDFRQGHKPITHQDSLSIQVVAELLRLPQRLQQAVLRYGSISIMKRASLSKSDLERLFQPLRQQRGLKIRARVLAVLDVLERENPSPAPARPNPPRGRGAVAQSA